MPTKVLVVTEKPSSARRIAHALDQNGNAEQRKHGQVSYYVATRDRKELIIVSAVGHLYTLVQAGSGWTYPTYETRWVPSYVADKKLNRVKPYIRAIEALGKDAEEYVSACDLDVEGSLIAYNVLKHAVGEHSLRKARRMKFSTLTPSELQNAWSNMSSELDYPVIFAGKARHETDWLFGINLSRALTLAVQGYTSERKTLSIGRVQGPTLGFIKTRETDINCFVPVPYWKVQAETNIDGQTYPLDYEKPRLEREVHAKKLAKDCRGATGTLTGIEKKAEKGLPPPPFNLSDLQREAYRVFKQEPSVTLKAAENLYLAAIISYPRTSSQQLPPSIDIKDILEQLKTSPQYAKDAEDLLKRGKLNPRQGRKTDPAHPAIHPTGARPRRLKDPEKRTYDLITRRFLACLGEPTVQEKIDATVDVNGHLFHLRGSTIKKRGWTTLYSPYVKLHEQPLPPLRQGMKIPVTKLSTRRGYTSPPERYNASSLLRTMENHGIGTKATRTQIVEKLKQRGYITGGSLRITDLGLSVAETLEQYSPDIMSVEMTRELEEELEKVQRAETKGDAVVEEAKKQLEPILSRFKENEKQIGESIAATLNLVEEKERGLGKCPSCGTGVIMMRHSKGAVYAQCSNARTGKCTQRYGLPQKKRVHPTGKACPHCGAPIVKLYYNRKPWHACINPDCPTKKEKNR